LFFLPIFVHFKSFPLFNVERNVTLSCGDNLGWTKCDNDDVDDDDDDDDEWTTSATARNNVHSRFYFYFLEKKTKNEGPCLHIIVIIITHPFITK